jgi:hypothetical protein
MFQIGTFKFALSWPAFWQDFSKGLYVSSYLLQCEKTIVPLVQINQETHKTLGFEIRNALGNMHKNVL